LVNGKNKGGNEQTGPWELVWCTKSMSSSVTRLKTIPTSVKTLSMMPLLLIGEGDYFVMASGLYVQKNYRDSLFAKFWFIKTLKL
jgi:hypothetical protein